MLEVVRAQLAFGEAFVGLAQVTGERRRAVAVHPAIEALDLIQRGAHLLATERRVVEEIDEVLDRLLEGDVVFPERVIAVDDQDLMVGHRGLSISSTRVPSAANGGTANRDSSRMGPP